MARILSFLSLALSLLTTSVTAQSVDSFTLINADTDTAIRSLSDGDTLDFSALPTDNLNVRANVSGSVGSVRFGYDDSNNYQIENVAPYALAGDQNGDYNAWTPTIGAHTITATPYTESDAGGSQGTPLTVNLTVTEGDNQCSTDLPSGFETRGELRRWHSISLIIEGPCVDEKASTFLDYRLNVTFTHNASGTNILVPGHFAADGNAAESGATSGSKWRAHFTPSMAGTWSFTVSFRTGTDVAISLDPGAGSSTDPDGLVGQFSIQPTNKTGRDHRAKGTLQYTGERYLQFENGEIFLKGGADSPENLLAYADFDNTSPTHQYQPHESDWQSGDPTWQGSKGKGLIGALNYLASEEMNAFSFLTMNVSGDGNDVWPWTAPNNRTVYDVSKLDQWEIVFSHSDQIGLFKHFKTQETENDQLLDGGSLGHERKLYYRELISRFGHHHALNWNLGEENTNTDSQRQAFANYIRQLDPYDHPVVVHTYPGQKDQVYSPLLGFPSFEGPSLQLSSMSANAANEDVVEWLNESQDAGRMWNTSVDEPGTANAGLQPDSDPNHEAARAVLWATLLGGGDGLEWYFGYGYPNDDLDAEDWRSRDQFWDYHRYALQFLHAEVDVTQMNSANALTTSTNDFVLAEENEQYVVYLPDGGSTELDLGSNTETYNVQWYDPRGGGSLLIGSVSEIEGPGTVSVGNPPSSANQDWVVLVTSQNPIPVELTSFKAIGRRNAAILQWETASEIQNAGFEIQRKVHDTFQQIDFIEGAGTTSQPQTYSHVVNGLDPGQHVFRLKQIDLDGSSTLSPEVSVLIEQENAVRLSSVYPNPFNTRSRFTVSVAENQEVNIALFDATGREARSIYHSTISPNEKYEFAIDGHGLPSGLYFIWVRGEYFERVLKAVKVK